MKKELTFAILIKNEDDIFIAHCLELDIVATNISVKSVQNDIIDLINAQVLYAFNNDNIENLYHPAPAEVWQEYLACKEIIKKKHQINKDNTKLKKLVFDSFSANICNQIQKECCVY